jgi:sarcosine oxidase, subunit beta
VQKKPSVVVVGGGVIGLSSAYYCATLGCDVVVLEKDSIAGASSGLSVGVYTRQYMTQLEIELRTRSYDELLKLERDGFELVRTGFMRLGHSTEDVALFEEGAELQRSLGVDDVRVISADDVHLLIPDMKTDDLVCALFSPTDGYMDGHGLTTTYGERAKALGARIMTRAALVGVDKGNGHEYLLRTTVGDIAADIVVNAAGAWAQEVGAMLGTRVEINAQRHQVAIGRFAHPLDYVVPMVMDYMPGSGDSGLYFRHEGRDQLLAGLHTNDLLDVPNEKPDDYLRTADASFVEDMAFRLAERLPGLSDMGIQGGWAGLYPVSKDTLPIVGPHAERPTVVAAAGRSGIGVHLAPAIGMLVAESIIYGETRAVAGAERLSPNRSSLVD